MILRCIFIICVFLPSVTLAWYDYDFDSITVKYDSGQLKEKYMVTNYYGNEKGFLKHGQFMSWYENGRVNISTEFEYGDLIDHSYILYDSLGGKLTDASYLDGKKHGPYIEWYPNHSYKKILYYKNDKLNGMCKWFGEYKRIFNEEFIKNKAFYLDGELVIFFVKEFERIDHMYPYENKDLGICFDFEKENFIVGKLKNGRRHGKWTTYNERGEIVKQDLYRDGELLDVVD